MVVVHGLCYTVEFSVVLVSLILSFDFLFQFYEGNLLVEAIIVFIPSLGTAIFNIAALIVSSLAVILIFLVAMEQAKFIPFVLPP